jgi:glycosyltransferase involved in cell wall biosynthesis
MRIRIFTVCKDEARIMPFFIDHYKEWADEILIFDGYSKDGSPDIALGRGDGKVIVKQFDFDGGKYLCDSKLCALRNDGWKAGSENFDWVIVVDNDEFIYHKDIRKKLKTYMEEGVTMPSIVGFDMMSMEFPTYGIPITQQVTQGWQSPSYTKQILFNPNLVTPNFLSGTHGFPPGDPKDCIKNTPVGRLVRSDEDPDKIWLLHYRKISYEFFVENARAAIKRFPMENYPNGSLKYEVTKPEYTREVHLQRHTGDPLFTDMKNFNMYNVCWRQNQTEPHVFPY